MVQKSKIAYFIDEAASGEFVACLALRRWTCCPMTAGGLFLRKAKRVGKSTQINAIFSSYEKHTVDAKDKFCPVLTHASSASGPK